MQLPDFLQTYRAVAEEIISNKGVLDLEFSGSTYQVQVKDENHPDGVWAFLQLDEHTHLKDGFCSCEDSEDVSRCRHLAVAYLQVFNGHNRPLHKRFSTSLWNQLCQLSAEKGGYDPSLLETDDDIHYRVQDIVTLKVKNPKSQLKEIMHQRTDETEETSLKFSGLSEEEIHLWREGRPSPQLQYELSFWNDIAKWLMLEQEKKKPYTVTFEEDKKHYPTTIKISTEELDFSFALTLEELEEIIPTLATVDSSLKVHNMGENLVRKVHYDEQKQTLFIDSELKVPPSLNKTVTIGNWIYVARDGFYGVGKQETLSKKEFSGPEIIHVLDHYHHFLSEYLPIAPHLHSLNYQVGFDSSWNLHIDTYLFEAGDLSKATTAFFGPWVYLSGVGFYRIEEKRFKDIHTVVPPEQVGEYVQYHRTWFNGQPGFETHLASVEGLLSYNLSEDGHLSFMRRFADASGEFNSRDFGAWVYVQGQGFFSKVSSLVGVPLRPGIALNRDQVASFIRMHRDDLQDIPQFFSEKCPIKSSSLKVKLTERGSLEVSPHFEPFPEYQEAELIFFDDFVFIRDEGFFQLSAELQLPPQYDEIRAFHLPQISYFYYEELPHLEKYDVQFEPSLRLAQDLHLILKKIKYDPKKKKYRLNLEYATEYGTITVPDIWEEKQLKKPFSFSEAGAIDLTQKVLQWLSHIGKSQIDRRGDVVLFSTVELIKLYALEHLMIQGSTDRETAKMEALFEELMNFVTPSKPDLTGLTSQLRHYQESGLDWLWFLYNYNLSGLLCDDMGLGKTHQAMALMAAIHNHNPPSHFLVICPTSVIYHWEDKLKEFLPNLRVCTFYGTKRVIEDYDILLTSYGVWRLESKNLKKRQFELAVFDEIQMAKNESSRLNASMRGVQATMRLGLTGTPIENQLNELKALFDITLPGYMPAKKEFKEQFVKPIEKENNPDAKGKLQRFIRPFMLRRTKEDVLPELPEKTEEVAHCGLLPEQQTLYKEALQRSKEQLLAELSHEDEPIPYIHIFAILSSLKQICDHPAVYLKKPDRYKEHRSGKWELFTELLNEARESNQKVVVFSQYLGMLDIIEEYLNELGIGFASIRGSTQKRGDQIRRFNKDPYCEVFVGSLQAAGLGVDLTAASVVIHYDRWWNAAKEDQATDRVHRIGQTRGVQVFKLVTKGTFEDRIDEMIKRKGQLMEDIVGKDDQHLVKYLTREEIIALLSYQEEDKQ